MGLRGHETTAPERRISHCPPDGGTLDILENDDNDAVRRYYEEWYRPDLQAVIAVGDFDKDYVMELLEKHFASIPKKENPREREVKVRFVLSKKADDFNNQTVYLKLKELEPGTTHYREYRSIPYQLRRSFTSDFDF